MKTYLWFGLMSLLAAAYCVWQGVVSLSDGDASGGGMLLGAAVFAGIIGQIFVRTAVETWK